jgi:hypothetical protein
MSPLVTYAWQVIVVSGILYGYYHFFLRNKRFHQYNRFYLLAATLISLVLPLISIPVQYSSEEEIPALYHVLTAVQVGGNAPVINSAFSWDIVLYCLYAFIGLLALTRFIVALNKLRRIVLKYPAEKIDDISFVNTHEAGTPYSFFRWLFWDEQLPLNSDRGQQVFRHELYHIRQRHSFDIIAMEILTIIGWINPFFHLVKKELKAIHEFLADRHALEQSDKWDYAELLLQKAFQTQHSFVNPFFHNQIKRRIAMITTTSKTSYQYLRKLMILPLACIVVSLVSVSCQADKKETLNPNQPTEKTELSVIEEEKEEPAPPPPNGAKENAGLQPVEVEKINEKAAMFKVDKEASFTGGEKGWRDFLVKNLNANTPVDNRAPEGTFTVTAMLLIGIDGRIEDIQMLSKAGYGMEAEVKRVLQLSPNWVPAKLNGKAVRSFKKQPVTFMVTAE